jgi:hypothetical protein
VKHLSVADNAADIMVAAVMAAVTKAATTSYLDNYYSQGGSYTMASAIKAVAAKWQHLSGQQQQSW